MGVANRVKALEKALGKSKQEVFVFWQAGDLFEDQDGNKVDQAHIDGLKGKGKIIVAVWE